MENNKMEDSEKKVRKPKSSDYYEQLLQSEFNHKEFVGEFKYPLEAREIIVRKTSKLIKLKIRMTDTNNPDKEVLYKFIVAAYNYAYFDKSAALSAKQFFLSIAPRFVEWLNIAVVTNRFEILKEYEEYQFDKMSNHGGVSRLTSLKTLFCHALDKSIELHEALTSSELSYLYELRKTKASPNLNKTQISLASYFGSISWLRRDDVGIGHELYNVLASPNLTVKSLSLTASTVINVLAKYKQELHSFFKSEGVDFSLFLIPKNLSHTKKRKFVGSTIYRLLSAYHRMKTPSCVLKGALEVVLLSNSNNFKSFQFLLSALASKTQCDDLFTSQSQFKGEVSSVFCAGTCSQVMPGNLFSFEVLQQITLDKFSPPATVIEELMFSWLMASQCVQPFDIPKLTVGSFRLLKVGGKVRNIECEYFKGRAKVFHTTRSLSVSTLEGEALVSYLSLRKESEYLVEKRALVISNGVNSLVGTLYCLLTTRVLSNYLIEHHRKLDNIPLSMPRALISLIKNTGGYAGIEGGPYNGLLVEDASKPVATTNLTCPVTLFGFQAIKNSAVHAFSDPYTLNYLINKNSHSNQTEKRHYLNSENENWINSAGRITREVMLDLINNVYDLDFEDLNTKGKKEAVERFNSEFMSVTQSVSYKAGEMLSRLRIITGQNKGVINDVGVSALDSVEDTPKLSFLYVMDSAVVAWKMFNYLHEFKKHYKKLLSRNSEYLYKTVLPTVEWAEHTLSQLSKESQEAGQAIFENAIKNRVVVSVFHSI